MNVDSSDFNELPSDIQYELLKDLKEIRKRRRTRLEAMPEESDSFSNYQLAGLLAKRKISKKMEHVEKRMSEETAASSSLRAGISEDIKNTHEVRASQIISDSTSHYIWMKKLDNKTDDEESKSEPIYSIPEEVLSNNAVNNQSFQPIPSISHITPPDTGNQSNLSQGEAVRIHETKPIATSSVIPEEEKTELSQSEAVKAAVSEEKSEASLPTASLCSPVELSNVDAEKMADRLHPVAENKIPEIVVVNDGRMSNKPEIISEIPPIQEIKNAQETFVSSSTNKFVPTDAGDESSEEEFIEVTESTGLTCPDHDQEDDGLADNKATIDENTEAEEVTGSQKDAPSPDPGLEVNEALSVLPVPNPWDELEIKDLEDMSAKLDQEILELRKMAQAKERASRDVSQTAELECQDLLKLFGLPFVKSPQEAEAQCAALELLGLTNGTITEDSDIWCFGGHYVIKNMFSSKSDPVSFDVTDVEMKLGLNRDRFICIALCAGSDYTCGIDGVGPVTAMEILKEFGGEGITALKNLKMWWKDVCSNEKVIAPKETKIKSQLRRINLKDDFPSDVVFRAYANPTVDETKSEFQWGFPDLDELRSFAMNTIGWTKGKVDEILLPIIKRMGKKRNTQSRITQYLPSSLHFSGKKKSKRVRRAVAGLTGKPEILPRPAKKVTKRTKKNIPKIVEVTESELKLSESSSED